MQALEQKHWIDLIESSAFALREKLHQPLSLSGLSPQQLAYSYALLATLENKRELHHQSRKTLRLVQSSASELDLYKKLLQLRSLFLYLRSPKRGAKRRKRFLLKIWNCYLRFINESQSTQFIYRLFLSEVFFVFSDLFFRNDQFETSAELTEKAILSYRELGAQKKALRSELNLIVDRAHQDPSHNRLPELFPILQRAKKLRDPVTISSCYHSISHEYECMGAYQNSLKTINRAISHAFTHHLTSRVGEYISHKVELLAKMDLKHKAKAAFEVLSTVPSEISEKAKSYLLSRHPWLEPKAFSTELDLALPATYWLDKTTISKPMGVLEETLIEFLSGQPRNKFELVQHLYGERVAYESAEARLKNLLYRIRKKHPGLIQLVNEHYSLEAELTKAGQS